MKSVCVSEQDKLKRVAELRARMQHLNEKMAELDIYGVSSPGEESEFWLGWVDEAEGLTRTLRKISQLQGGSARDRILNYLEKHMGEPVEGSTLAAVSGILSWARRVRELSRDYGYDISTSTTDPNLKPGQYRLESLAPASPENQM